LMVKARGSGPFLLERRRGVELARVVPPGRPGLR
jgi:hypothetical protein